MEATAAQAAHDRVEAIQELIGKAMLQAGMLAGELRHNDDHENGQELASINNDLGPIYDRLIAVKQQLDD